MKRFLKFDQSDKSIGFSARNMVEGPESDMLNLFVEQYIGRLDSNRKHYALFFEPLMPTGYPDLVIVQYNPAVYDEWTDQRGALQILDLKLLHHLHFARGATSGMLSKRLGMEGGLLLKSLERLMDASLADRNRKTKQWVPSKLRQSYSVQGIKTIEAKISDWGNVFKQAGMNRLFASESYVLSPVANPAPHIVAKAHENGIGIFSMPDGKKIKLLRKPERISGLPVSYASWLFNEWIGRRLVPTRKVAQ
jgi:hypothetical protein